jgi:hypothetical protein
VGRHGREGASQQNDTDTLPDHVPSPCCGTRQSRPPQDRSGGQIRELLVKTSSNYAQ